ncbi:MAG TPA: hypothetical protein VF794_08495 [Archangium sp.]|jgi:ElaB/YqjD/DUF883 family membrane-anchored ribosome-binding protein|uniref:hypothetical protein n=1 Tax=Archangium sp. TaxID=1872627 RepID=UPI002ED85D38
MASATEGIQGSSFAGTSTGTGDVSQQVKRFTGATRERVYHQVDDKKEDILKGLQGFVSTLENASQNADGLSQQVLQGAVGYLRKFSDRIENGTTEELVHEARQFVRERPAPFFAGCIAVGFLAARLLKE